MSLLYNRKVIPLIPTLATQMLALAFILPFILDENEVVTNRPEYRVFLMMLELTSMLLSYKFSKTDANTAATLIKLYLQAWSDVYGSHTITPKMHYLVHIPHYIEK